VKKGETLILLALCPGTEMSGLEIKNALPLLGTGMSRLLFWLARCWMLGGTYVALRSLEDRGLVRSREEPGSATPERGGIPRRLYEITADGYKALLEVAGGA
jgi:DNA-binding PadR family transcriptional regulator